MMRAILRRSALLAVALMAAVALGSGGHALAQTAGGMITATQSTASYKVELDIGPQATMLTPDQAAGATSGEIMVDPSTLSTSGAGMGAAPMSGMPMGGMAMGAGQMGGMAMSSPSMSGMSMSPGQMGGVSSGAASMSMGMQAAQGNHHLEVHIYDATTGDVVSNIMPSISVVNTATGANAGLGSIMAMYDLQVGLGDLHFGNNLQLDPGTYAVTVTVGSESTTFNNVVVSGM